MKINYFILIILRNIRSNKGRENRLSPSSACECGATDNGQCSTNNCGYNSEDEYRDFSKQCSQMEWDEVIILFTS